MAPLAEAFVRIRPDTSGFRSESERGISGAGFGKLGQQHGRAFGQSFTAGFRPVVAAIGGVLASVGLVNFLRDAIAEQREAVRIGNLTAAVIKSTGGAAGITATQVGDLADRLSALNGVDDEVVQSGENLLLTFTNVRNAVGRGNDIFNQAAAAAVDMTAALHNGQVTVEGVDGAAIQLGKALNDPIQGLTALRRVGVSFTAAQIEQITAMQKSGNIMGAQKIILGELRKEFGGAAAAAADPAQRATVAWENFKERIGGLVMPVVAALIGLLSGRLLPIVEGRIIPAVLALGRWLAGLAGWFRAGFAEGVSRTEGLAGAMNLLGAAARFVVDLFRDTLIPALRAAIGWLSGGSTWAGIIRQALLGAAVAIGAIVIAVKLWTAAQALLNIVLTANPIGLIIVAVAALVAGFIFAYTHSARFREIVDAALHGIAAVALWLWNTVLKPTWDLLVAELRLIATVATWLWRNILSPAFTGIAAVATWMWNTVLAPTFAAWRAIIANVIGPVVLWLYNNITRPVFQGIASVVGVAWAIISVIFRAWWAYISNVLAPAIMWLWRNVIAPAFNAIGAAISFVWNTVIRPVFAALGSIIRDQVAPAFRVGVDAISAAWGRVRDAAKAPVNFVIGTVINRGIIDTWNTVAGWFGVKGVGHLATLAAGGVVPGQGRGDIVPAMLEPGERVLSRAQVAALGGHGAIDNLVGRGTGGNGAYQGGGIIDLITDPVGWLRGRASGLINQIGGTHVGQILHGMANRALDALIGKVRTLLGGTVRSLTGRVAGGQLGRWIAQGMAITGVPGSWAGPLNTLIMRESGGNPRAINLWDINAQRGDPSRGLMQTIGATFRRYRLPGLSADIYDPIANIVAGIRYILARYGTIFNVQQAVGRTPRGYARGGMVPGPVDSPQPAVVHGGERILSTTEQARGIRLDDYSIARLAQALRSRPVQVDIVGPDWGLGVAGVAP